jgi:hypothetical protein
MVDLMSRQQRRQSNITLFEPELSVVMGKIEINIPRELENAFEEAFPGEDKAEAVWRIIRQEIERKRAAPVLSSKKSLVELAKEIRASGPLFSAEDVQRAREEGRS